MISYFRSSRPGAVNNVQPWASKSDVTALRGDYISRLHTCVYCELQGKAYSSFLLLQLHYQSWKAGAGQVSLKSLE